MAAINDLISKIEDAELRKRIEAELKRLLEHKDFGLVFEDHVPEGLDEGPIYPTLEVMDEVRRAPDRQLWHALIEADNYYALQLLAYLYPGQVDCIYIDPPYNTGARDWKYNNDYVDTSDQYRHSKWLSMMKRRLLLAKRLLNPRDSVLIVTIDEKEYLHLGCLLEELFPEARMQMVSCCIMPGGVSRLNEFARCDEYIFFLKFGVSSPCSLPLSDDWLNGVKNTSKTKVHWEGLLRTGTNNMRSDRPNLFYPVLVSENGKRFIGAGEPLKLHEDRMTYEAPIGSKAIWPMHKDGTEGRWRIGRETLLDLYNNHVVRLGGFTERGMAINYLKKGEYAKVLDGQYKVVGIREDNSYELDDSEYKPTFVPATQWVISTHDASRHGSGMLSKFFPDKRFSFPKSLYAVHDAIRFFVANKPEALVVDFFAGSGTTLHAVNLLNAEDGGRRRCIMVTNNEVSEQEAKGLAKQGYGPGDDEWERLGIARYVCWPRTVCSIEGHDVNGQPLNGEYLGTDHRQMSDGFESNCVFFKLNCLDKTKVALGRQFKELVPLLWMKAGAVGPCPRLEGDVVPQMLVLPENGFAVLTDEKTFGEFVERVNELPEVGMVYLVVDSDSMYRDMARCFPQKRTCQLYRDYLDNFRINVVR